MLSCTRRLWDKRKRKHDTQRVASSPRKSSRHLQLLSLALAVGPNLHLKGGGARPVFSVLYVCRQTRPQFNGGRAEVWRALQLGCSKLDADGVLIQQPQLSIHSRPPVDKREDKARHLSATTSNPAAAAAAATTEYYYLVQAHAPLSHGVAPPTATTAQRRNGQQGWSDSDTGPTSTCEVDLLCAERVVWKTRSEKETERAVSIPGGVAVVARRFHAGRTI